MTDLPQTMRAIDPEEAGGPEVLGAVDRPVPRPGPGEVLVRVAAAGVNRPDAMQRQGKYPPPPGAPSILGLELAGEIVALGEGTGTLRRVGDRVCALVSGGAYADYAVAPAAQCLPVPDALPMAEAGALPETLFTVWTNLFQRAAAQQGETILVHGGTSGIGTMASRLGRLFGLTVIVTAGSATKCAAALAAGAAHAIDYNATDFVEEVARLTDRRGVDIVLDMVGGDYIPRNLKCLAEEGRHVSIAGQRGGSAEVPLWPLMMKRIVMTGSTLRGRDAAFKARAAAEIAARVWPHVAAGRLRPVMDRSFPLADAAAAHARLESGGHVGKIVLTTGT
ncbi:MAG: NAD(P)H-quinone oxidoreductase [Sphingomonas fennica]